MGQERLAKNIPRTIDNTRVYDSSSYLTADPATLRAAAEKAAEASKALNADDDEDEDDEDEDDDMEESDEDEEEDEDETSKAGPSRLPANATKASAENGPTADETTETPSIPFQPTLPPGPPPRIMITTSPSPCKDTYAFCEDLKGIFPGGEFFKRPKGKGFEIGRVARWAAKRGFNAVCVVNEDHKLASKSIVGGGRTQKVKSMLMCRCDNDHGASSWTYCLFQVDQYDARKENIWAC